MGALIRLNPAGWPALIWLSGTAAFDLVASDRTLDPTEPHGRFAPLAAQYARAVRPSGWLSRGSSRLRERRQPSQRGHQHRQRVGMPRDGTRLKTSPAR